MEKLKKLTKTILVEIHPNKHYRTYHLKTKDVSKEKTTAIGKIEGVVKNLFGDELRFSPDQYEFSISKGKAWEWEEIEPEILEILARK